MKILILEDELIIAQTVLRICSTFGQTVVASALESAYELLDKQKFEIAILDRKLPDGDAIEIVQYLRNESPKTKILLLTQLSSLPERLVGWHSGADDYIAKPFASEELRLRVARLLSLQRELSNQWQSYGKVTFNPHTGEARSGSKPLRIRPKEFQLFVTLWRHRNQVLDRNTLISSIWGTAEHPTQATLDVYVRRLRMSLRQTSIAILTQHGYGYKMSLESNN